VSESHGPESVEDHGPVTSGCHGPSQSNLNLKATSARETQAHQARPAAGRARGGGVFQVDPSHESSPVSPVSVTENCFPGRRARAHSLMPGLPLLRLSRARLGSRACTVLSVGRSPSVTLQLWSNCPVLPVRVRFCPSGDAKDPTRLA
jgi:hypothetical protein